MRVSEDGLLDSVAGKALIEATSMSVFCHKHPLATLRPDLTAEGVVMAKDLRRMRSGSKVRVSGVLVIVHMPPTKSGKRVIFITIEDESGLMDLVAFEKAQKRYAQDILTSEVLTVEGRLQRRGNGLAISIILEELILPWTGKLSDLLLKKACPPTQVIPELSLKRRG
jgi:DNA polymerase III alpha subunit